MTCRFPTLGTGSRGLRKEGDCKIEGKWLERPLKHFHVCVIQVCIEAAGLRPFVDGGEETLHHTDTQFRAREGLFVAHPSFRRLVFCWLRSHRTFLRIANWLFLLPVACREQVSFAHGGVGD